MLQATSSAIAANAIRDPDTKEIIGFKMSEEKLRECIDGELRYAGLAWMFGGFMLYFSLIIIPLFLIYFYFYFKWVRKNYFRT